MSRQQQEEALRKHRLAQLQALSSEPEPVGSEACLLGHSIPSSAVVDDYKYDKEADYAYNGCDEEDNKAISSLIEKKMRRKTAKHKRHKSKHNKASSLTGEFSNLRKLQSKQFPQELPFISAAAGTTLLPLLGTGGSITTAMSSLPPAPLLSAPYPPSPSSILANASAMTAAVCSAEARALQSHCDWKRIKDELEVARYAQAQASARLSHQLQPQGCSQLGLERQNQLELQHQLEIQKQLNHALLNDPANKSHALLVGSSALTPHHHQLFGMNNSPVKRASSNAKTSRSLSQRVPLASTSLSTLIKPNEPNEPRKHRINNRNIVLVAEPDDNDVLCGRDKSYNRHPGNKVFKAVIAAKAHLYCATTTKQEKMNMTKLIVNTLKTEHGTRFLKPVKFKGVATPTSPSSPEQSIVPTSLHVWEEISDQLARDKVSHSLRFTASQRERKYYRLKFEENRKGTNIGGMNRVLYPRLCMFGKKSATS